LTCLLLLVLGYTQGQANGLGSFEHRSVQRTARGVVQVLVAERKEDRLHLTLQAQFLALISFA
jgi:hypothetical protein